MPASGEGLAKKLMEEIEYYRAQNENLRRELTHLEDSFHNNRERLEIIKRDFEESEEMVRVMKLITSR